MEQHRLPETRRRRFFLGLRRSAENQKFKLAVYVKALRLEWVFLPDFKALQMQAFVHRKTNDF